MGSVICRDLCKTFSQGGETITGLAQVDLEVEEAGFLCLSGPSGSGKTTLLNAIGGLDTPDSGSITVAGQRLEQLNPAQLARLRLHKIGFVFQAYNLIPVLSARENVEFVMQLQGRDARTRRVLATDILREVGLAGLEGRRPAELSGGQQQRVAVARAIVSDPALILADEPTANLDSNNAIQLMDLFCELNRRRGVTLVLATHDSQVMSRCPRLVRMRDGRIASDQPQPDCS